jgi:hypothetical protein
MLARRMLKRDALFQLSFHLAILAIGLAAGCGGGGSALPVRTDVPLSISCPDDEFTPNETRYTSHLYRLTKLPVFVHFIKDQNLTAMRHESALAGFRQWVTATGGRINFVETSLADANVTVQFTDHLPPGIYGLTDLNYYIYDQVVNGGAISISISEADTPARIQATAAHEFGHVLGLNVHTPNCEDVMAKTFFCGFPTSPMPLSQSDINTLKTAYCWMFPKP